MAPKHSLEKMQNCLVRHIAERGHTPHCNPVAISPWLAMSMMQKAIRRGETARALRAAATLLQDAPERLWRRMGVIAFEDIGVADLRTVAMVTVALAGKRFRQPLGGEWAVASLLVELMAKAPKNRAADDLFAVLESWPDLAERRTRFAGLSNDQLRVIALGTGPLEVRALAFWYLVGTDRVGSDNLLMRKGNPALAFDLLDELGVAPTMQEIAREGFRRTNELICPLVAMLSLENGLRDATANDPIPPSAMITGLPAYALDMFTREGRAALALLLSEDVGISAWIKRLTPPAGRVEFMAQLLFRVESGLMLQRRDGELGIELRRKMDFECLGVPLDHATEAMGLMRSSLPRLNTLRRELVGGQNNAK